MKLLTFFVVACAVFVLAASAVLADQVIRKEFVPVDETPRWVEDEFVLAVKAAFKSNISIQRNLVDDEVSINIPSLQTLITRHGVTDMRRQFLDAQPVPAGSSAIDLTTYYKVKLEPGANLDFAAAAFASDLTVDHVEKIGIHSLSANCATGTLRPANDTYYNNPPPTFNWPQWDLWNTKGIDAEMAWNVQTGDATVVVVAMDSGVKYTHKDLGGNNPPGPADNVTDGNVWVNPFETPGNGVDDEGNGFIDDVVGYDFVTGVTGCAAGEDCSTVDNNPMDFNGHGTHTAGTMAALTNNFRSVAGIAGGFGDGTVNSVGNGCKIMCMRIGWSDAQGNGFVRMDFAAQAINYVVGMKQRGVNVAAINASWGSSNSGGIAAALDNAMNNDILITKAAGNSPTGVADYIGGRSEILVVAATDAAGLKASFSNFGSWVDIAAPGVSIISTYQVGTDPIPDYVAVLDGTSMAAPHCAGVAALLESQNSALTRADKWSIMTGNTCVAGSPNIGGILNAKKALDAAGGGGPVTPVAAFVGSPTSGGCGSLTVNFTDQSTNTPTSWAWDFGDGGNSTTQHPSHNYAAPGSYTVSLTATNAAGSDAEVKVGYINVSAGSAPVADFSGTPTSGAAPLTVNFTDLSTNSPTSWSWDFGDGGTSTAQNPSRVYANAGTYNVTLTASNTCGSDPEVKNAYITVTGPTWTVITSDNFEAGFGSFTDGGTDCIRWTGGSSNAHEGVAAIDIQDNTTTSLFSSTGNHNVTAYQTLEVSFWFKAVSMEAGEDFWLQYFNGTSWVTVADYNSGTEFVNNVFTQSTVLIRRSTHTFPTNAKIRFRCDASNDNDDVYIDEVVWRGTASVLFPPITSIPTLASADPVPRNYTLEQNYPNPFNAGTVIGFSLDSPGEVQLTVYDILGRTVRHLATGYFEAGPHTVSFDGTDDRGNALASGVYLYRIAVPGFVQSRKMVLLK